MRCPLCPQNVITCYTKHGFMSYHLRHAHYLHSSCDVIARAMFQSSAGYKEAVEVLKDFEKRDQQYRTLQFNMLWQAPPSTNKCDQIVQTEAEETTCDQIVQTEETAIKEEEELLEARRNHDIKSKEEKFGEYWEEEGKFIQPNDQNCVFDALTLEENEILDKIKEFLEYQNKEIASLNIKLMLSKEREESVSKDISASKKRLEELEHHMSAKDRELFSLKAKIKNGAAKESALAKALSTANKLVAENEKKVKAVEEKEKEQEKNTFSLLENTRKSLDALLDFNVTSKNKVVEAAMNTKTACKFMVREVTKKFEDFEAELENMDDSFTVDGEADYNENVKGKTKRQKTVNFDGEDSTHLEEANKIPEHSQASKERSIIKMSWKGKTKRLKTVNIDGEDSTHLEEPNKIPEHSQASKRKVDNNNVMEVDGSQCVTKHWKRKSGT